MSTKQQRATVERDGATEWRVHRTNGTGFITIPDPSSFSEHEGVIRELCEAIDSPPPVPMILHCPECRARHIDAGEFATKWHHTHACQHCGMVWRPAIGPTIGVQFLPGFKNTEPKS
jgi:hypothetical protein